jgi:hypothetical protein
MFWSFGWRTSDTKQLMNVHWEEEERPVALNRKQATMNFNKKKKR